MSFSSENDWGIVTLSHFDKRFIISDYYNMYPHFFDWRKETAVQPPKKRLSTPALLPQLLSPSKGTKRTTERTEISNLNRRRSGRQRIFIFPLPPDRFCCTAIS
ncbi:MAG: hypothetical protein IKJ63_01975, partial [Clostridia bacterium]|nr:hypothetical protein [Clostridia bacterium]